MRKIRDGKGAFVKKVTSNWNSVRISHAPQGLLKIERWSCRSDGYTATGVMSLTPDEPIRRGKAGV